MIVVEFLKSIEISKFAPYSDFVYLSKINYETQAAWWTDVFGAPDETTTERIFVNRFTRGVLEERYNKANSINDCQSTEKSFYWDHENQIIYVHFEHNQSWYTDMYYYGKAFGYNDYDVVYIDDTEYLPLVESVPSIAQQADIQNYDSMAFVNGSIVLNSAGGLIDFLKDEDNFGQDIFLYYLNEDNIVTGNAARSDLIALAAFYIENFTFGTARTVFNVQDIRKAQNIQIPIYLFNNTDYPDIEEKYINTPIPLIYGPISEAEAIPVDGNSTGDVTFRLAKTLTSIGQIQIFENDAWSNVSQISDDINNGSFVLAYSDCRKGGTTTGDILKCKVGSSTGEIVSYATDVIKYLNLEALGIDYTASNYDTTEWEDEEKRLVEIGVMFNKSITLFEAIRQVQAGANLGFRYEIKPDGRRTIRIDNDARAISYIVDQTEIEDNLDLNVQSESDLIAGIAKINYKKNYVDDTYMIEIDRSQEQTVKERYRQTPTYEVDTFLQNSTNALLRSQDILTKFSIIPLFLEVALIGESWYNLRIYDILQIAITSGEIDLDSGEITGREFFGLWKTKVISIDPDFNQIKNKIKLLLVEPVYTILEIHESNGYDIYEIYESDDLDLLEIHET